MMSDSLPETIRAIAFPAAGHTFALPMQTILKVSHCPPATDSSFDQAGLIQLGSETIALINLSQHLQAQETEPETAATDSRSQFLIVARAPSRELYGIQIDELPNMLDIPTTTIRPLPATARRSSLSRLAKYAALWQTTAAETLIFLLDLSLATQALAGQRRA